jgi:phosphotransferase system enzyme I (PtsP)
MNDTPMLSTLRRIIQEVNSANDFDEALLVLVKRTKEAVEADACSIYLVDCFSDEFILLATKGLSSKLVGSVRFHLSKGVIGLVGRREESVNVEDVTAVPEYYPIDRLGEEVYRGFLAVPIIHQRRLIGVIVVQKHEIKMFSDKDESFLITLAIQVADEIAHAEKAGLISQLSHAKDGQEECLYSGIPSAPGVGIGTVVISFPPADLDAVPDKQAENPDVEIEAFKTSLEAVRKEIRSLSERLESNLSPEDQALFDAYLMILDDSGLGVEVEQEIRKGSWAQGALRKVMKAHVRQFENMENGYLRERAEDVRDLGKRVLAHLQEKEREIPEAYPEKIVLVGSEVSAASLAEIPVSQLVAIVSGRGSSNSHVAILAKGLGVPAVLGVEDLSLATVDAKQVVVDGYYGQVHISPQAAKLRDFARLAEEEWQLDEDLKNLENVPAETLDHHRVEILVNTGLAEELDGVSIGRVGVGLYRTEVPFLMRDSFPTAKEQTAWYRKLLQSISPCPVTMRTLDIGGDKSLSYFPIEEDNPFLGWRGIRIALDHPEIFLVQIRAMLKASSGLNNLRIMLPMVSDVAELDEALRLIHKAFAELSAQDKAVVMPQVGVMIEVPSAVYQVKSLAQRVDFLSVGSNDLTQYLLAVDRNNYRVANLYDSLHPAVLKALKEIVTVGHEEGSYVSICGEMAGDPSAVLLLLGMGYDALSMSASRILRTKWVIRKFKYQDAQALVDEVLSMDSAVTIRNHMESVLKQAGLGGLTRAGRY